MLSKCVLYTLYMCIYAEKFSNIYTELLLKVSKEGKQQTFYNFCALTEQFGNVVGDIVISPRERKWDSSHSQKCYGNGLLLYTLLCLGGEVMGLLLRQYKYKEGVICSSCIIRENLQIFSFCLC